ncbi:MAG: VIT and vWA domain-containing protein, partial [Myxococcales bacterium]
MTRWICALVGAVLVPCPAFAGILLPKEPGKEPRQVRKQLIDVQVKDQVARATVDEVFENLTDQPLEADYLLPLPDGAAVSGFANWIDGKRVESVVRERSQAKEQYEQAKQQKAQPALLERDEAGIFRTRVDGIPAHGTRRIEAQFAQILPYDGGLVTLRIPLAIKGREGAAPVGDFRFRLQVTDQKKITELKVLSHPAAVERVSANELKVTLDAKGVRPEQELVVTYRTESSRLGLSFVPFRPAGESEGYFLLLASPQELTTAADIVHKDVVFVFDTSGSMGSEDKIGQARQALKRCLTNLNKEDNFGIVAFSDSMNPFRNKLVRASPENVAQALQFADGLQAAGGTNISGALLSGLQMVESSERPRVLVFMTDGIPSAGISDPVAVAEVVKSKNTGGGRIFSFGVGSDVNRTLLEKVSSENRGSHDFVERGQSIDQVVGTFYAKISRPVLSDLSFDFGDVTVTMQYPDVLPDLYKGSQLVLVGRYRGAGKVKAQLVGTLNGKKHAIPFDAEFPEEESSNAFVARLWAQRRIDYLMSQNRLHGERDEARTEIIALSMRHQILTPYTSMVAMRDDAVRLASVSPARVKPGDPVVHVRAPRDAERVT